MTPVISPWVFYLMSVTGAVSVISILAATFGGIAWAVVAALHAFCWEKGEAGYEEMQKLRKNLARIFAVALILSVIVPEEKTAVRMAVAQNVTYERVEAATDVVQTVYEDIMDLFAEEENE